jgi:hypothetical protein
MRAKVNKYLDPKRYSDEDDTPRMLEDDETKDVRKELAHSKAQIGRLQNQARIAEEIRKKELQKYQDLEERLRNFKRYHYTVELAVGRWLRQGNDVGTAFTVWRHHLRHAKALREVEHLRNQVTGMKDRNMARLKQYLELWQGNVERAAFQDTFKSWAHAAETGNLYRQIAVAEGAAEAARAQLTPLQEQVLELERQLAEKEAEMAAALALAAEEIARLKAQQPHRAEEMVKINEEAIAEEVRRRTMLLKPVADAEVQCNDEVFEEVPPELRTVSREGIPVARETIISTQLNGRIGELEEQVRELQVALHLSEERCKAEARRHEEEVAALRA